MTDQRSILLTVDGAVAKPLRLTFDDLAGLPAADQVDDISRFHPTRRGSGVALGAVLRLAEVAPEARYLTLHADDDFHASVPLAEVLPEAVVVYHRNGRLMSPEEGGPLRFIIKNPAACHTDELDDCANVKYLNRIELSVARGQDTRPHTDFEHEELHRAEG